MNPEIEFRQKYKPDYTGMTLTELPFCEIENYSKVRQIYKLDFITQANQDTGLKPVIFFIHGGGFIQPCAKRQAYISMFARILTAAGYAVVAPDYPVFDDGAQMAEAGGETACYAKSGEAIHYACRFIKEHAEELGLDSDKTAIIGGSAGGMAAFYAIANYTDSYRAFINLWGAPEQVPKLAGFPPTLSVHGNVDELVAYEREYSVQEELSRYGIEHYLITLDGSGHTPLNRMDEYMPQIMKLLNKVLGIRADCGCGKKDKAGYVRI